MSDASGSGATLVTGASGFLGGLVTAALLATERRPVVLPIRPSSQPAACRDRIRQALADFGVPGDDLDELLALATLVELPNLDDFAKQRNRRSLGLSGRWKLVLLAGKPENRTNEVRP